MSQLLIDGAMPDAASLAGILAKINATIANITNVTGTIAAGQVAFGTGTNIIGGSPELTWVPADHALYAITPNFTILNNNNPPNGAILQLADDGSWSLSNALGVAISNTAAGNLAIVGTPALDLNTADITFSDPSAATPTLVLSARGSHARLTLNAVGSAQLNAGSSGNLSLAANGSWNLSGAVGAIASDASGAISLQNNVGTLIDDASTGAWYSDSGVDLGKSASQWGTVFATAYHVGASAGVDFSGAIHNLTIVKGIVTAAS